MEEKKKEELCQGGARGVFFKDVNKGRKSGVGLHQKAFDKTVEPPHDSHLFNCGQPFVEKD